MTTERKPKQVEPKCTCGAAALGRRHFTNLCPAYDYEKDKAASYEEFILNKAGLGYRP
jgi:hypothetical protein